MEKLVYENAPDCSTRNVYINYYQSVFTDNIQLGLFMMMRYAKLLKLIPMHPQDVEEEGKAVIVYELLQLCLYLSLSVVESL